MDSDHTNKTKLLRSYRCIYSLLCSACLYGLLPLEYWMKAGLLIILSVHAYLLLLRNG